MHLRDSDGSTKYFSNDIIVDLKGNAGWHFLTMTKTMIKAIAQVSTIPTDFITYNVKESEGDSERAREK